jgi:hypothetical protein
MADQIEGGSGRADNVKGATKDDDANIELHDLGQGENTAAAMRGLEVNKVLYQRDLGADARYLIALDPDRPEVGGTSPNIPKDQSITS